jgi:hypothetical protein
MKPHLSKFKGAWCCASVVAGRCITGFGGTEAEAYADWQEASKQPAPFPVPMSYGGVASFALAQAVAAAAPAPSVGGGW